MSNNCPSCKFTLVDNENPLEVLKMLRVRKKNGDDVKYPILVADFYCKECKWTKHLKWIDLNKDINILKCPNCGKELFSSVFLGIMNGFNLQSFCFSCYKKLNSGDIEFYQK